MHSLHLQSTEEKRGGESTFSNNSNSNLADPMLVHPELLRLLMRNIIIMSLEEDFAKGSSKLIASSYPKSKDAISSVGCLRKRLVNEGISEKASDLTKRRQLHCLLYSRENYIESVNWPNNNNPKFQGRHI